MTLDEAHLILNMKRGDSMEQILQVRPVLNWEEDRSPPKKFDSTVLVPRAISTCSRQIRRQKCLQRPRLVHGVRQRLGTRTTCSQRWCGRASGSRQKRRLQPPRSHQVDHLGRLSRPRTRVRQLTGYYTFCVLVMSIGYVMSSRFTVMRSWCHHHPRSSQLLFPLPSSNPIVSI